MRILTIRLGAIGDVVTCLPALHALRTRLPDATLHHLVEPPAAALLRVHPWIDSVIVAERKLIAQQAKRFSFEALGHLREQLRSNQYDIVIDWHGLMRSAYLAGGTASPVRVGRRYWPELTPLFYTSALVVEPSTRQLGSTAPPVRNVVEDHMALAEHALFAYGLAAPKLVCAPPPRAAGSSENRKRVDDLLRSLGFRSAPVVVAPGSKWPRRAWPNELVLAVGKLLAHRHVPFLLVGGPAEGGLAELAAESGWPVSLELDLPCLDILLQRCSAFVGADSAPMHIADMAETPSVVVFGPSSPERYGPRFARHKILRDGAFAHEHDFRGRPNVDYFAHIDATSVVDAVVEVRRV